MLWLLTSGLTRDRKYGDAVYQNKSSLSLILVVLAKMKAVLTLTWQNSQNCHP
jgi:hypothetical protein